MTSVTNSSTSADFSFVSVHVGAQGLSPGDNLKNVTSIFSITDSWFSSFEPLDRQKDEW